MQAYKHMKDKYTSHYYGSWYIVYQVGYKALCSAGGLPSLKEADRTKCKPDKRRRSLTTW